ncbi:hypothetical protein ACH4FX_20685 [Streptomyces sp. NPDC018019]|uniref:hypothetical protein n=1 Tax=Streptomyces sp. NPDC018019 TaxID=3365030 RepID=UPI0037B703A6
MAFVTVAGMAVGAGIAAAAPAAAGGVGSVLSPAFGTTCANRDGTQARGSTTHSSGAGGGTLAALPIGSPFTQCDGADDFVLKLITNAEARMAFEIDPQN